MCHAARPRHLAQAIANANAVANEGETVVANSGATSTGDLTVSDVSAKGAGPGTTVNCEQQAKNGEVLSKECGGKGEETVPAAETAAKTEAKSTAATTTNAEAQSTATTEVSSTWLNAAWATCMHPLGQGGCCAAYVIQANSGNFVATSPPRSCHASCYCSACMNSQCVVRWPWPSCALASLMA